MMDGSKILENPETTARRELVFPGGRSPFSRRDLNFFLGGIVPQFACWALYFWPLALDEGKSRTCSSQSVSEEG